MRTQLELLEGKYTALPDEIISLTQCLSVKSVYNCLILAYRVLKQPFDVTGLGARPIPPQSPMMWGC